MAKITRARFKYTNSVKRPSGQAVGLGTGALSVRFVNVPDAAPTVRIDVEGTEPGAETEAATWTIRLDEAEGLQALGRLAMAYGFKLVKETA